MAFNFNHDDGDGSGPAPMAEINIIPLVDVMLVLLIITMITSPFLERGVDVNLPVAEGKNLRSGQSAEEPVTLFVSKDMNIRIGQTSLRIGDLSEKLKLVFKSRVGKELFVKADKEVPYGFVAEIMAKVQSAGILKVGLVTQAD
ncbi:protein TolR [bacterium]|nr:protein TolR [bacterium]